ncbi:MAG TPA: VapE domain-containing protein, partial [Gammaproteobacteria bacterium]|nr:VapE domain-containing protein [Gammaproteobacteria bacterium]
MLREHYQDRLKLNQFTLRQELDGEDLKQVQATGIRLWLEEVTDKSFGRDIVNDAIDLVCYEQGYAPLIEYLDRLKWDGVSRLETWLSDVYGAEQNEYTAAVGKCWPASGVARAYNPGCKVRNVLLLSGIEDLGKSISLEDFCPVRDWFTDSLSADLHSKDAAITLCGKWIVESAEMASMKRSEQEAVKAFLSRNVDDFRPPYGRKN